MKQVTEFLRIQAELLAKPPADNSANSTGFYIFEIFLFLACLNFVSAEFFKIFKKLMGSLGSDFYPPTKFVNPETKTARSKTGGGQDQTVRTKKLSCGQTAKSD
jgi:hypothetical protein